MSENPKKIEIVSGKKNDLEISKVATHLNVAKPKIKDDNTKGQEIVVPQSKENCKNKKEN